MLSHSQIKTAVRNKQEDDRHEYGSQESPDSWAYAQDPATTYLNRVYSAKAVRELVYNEVNDHKSFAFYYVDQKTWDEHFKSKKQGKAQEKLGAKLVKLRAELEALISSSIKDSGLGEFLKSEEVDAEPKFWACERCKSKINMRMYYRLHRSLAERCPACGHKDAEILSSWRQKLLGKAYAAKRAKLESAIEAAEKEMKELDVEETSSVWASDIEKHKALMKAVRTLIAADIHH
jgi:rubrerythrin